MLNELEEAIEKHMKAWSTGDIETILDFEENSVQFGYRTKDVRDFTKIRRNDYKGFIKQFFQNFKSFESVLIDGEARVIGDTGIAFGHHKERMKRKDGQIQEMVVRSTATWGKMNGKWKMIMSHRDIQFSEGN